MSPNLAVEWVAKERINSKFVSFDSSMLLLLLQLLFLDLIQDNMPCGRCGAAHNEFLHSLVDE